MKQSKTTFRPEIESPVCKVELKGPAAGGAAAPFRYFIIENPHIVSRSVPSMRFDFQAAGLLKQ